MGNGIGTPEAVNVITATHLALVAVLIVLVVFAIWWGAKRRAARRRAEEEALDRREEAPPPPPVDHKEPSPRVEPPVSPPPPLANDEPIPASAPQEANPAAQAADEQVAPEPGSVAGTTPATPAASADGLADAPVTLIKGLGPKVAARLAENGITRVDQLAALSDAETAALDAKLGNFAGRMARDRWRDQARLLAAGDRAGFEATFGKLG